VVIVSHGPEVVVFARKNYAKYKDIADRAAAFAKLGVRFEICQNAARFLGFNADDMHGFVTLVPPAPYALAYWQAKGYTLNAVGATMPTTPLSDLNRADTNR
jgi:intracellular sulfur oxidation DsrE/DsrF family protein